MVTSSRRPELWIVPGGGVEPNEEPSVTAVREVLEEAGVVGELGRCLGVFEVSQIYILVFFYYWECPKLDYYEKHRLLCNFSKLRKKFYFVSSSNHW